MTGLNCTARLLTAGASKQTLVVAKLDRLSRNAAFLLALQEGKVPLVCCDNPHANELTIGPLAVIAHREARMISKRTTEALQAAKAKKGIKLGSQRPGHWDGREDRRLEGLQKARLASVEAKAKAAAEAYSDLVPMIRELRKDGASLQVIAARLNGEGYSTRQGKASTPMTIHRIIKKAG